MDSDYENEIPLTPPEITEAAKLTSLNLLPEKSQNLYMTTYKSFMDWRVAKNVKSFSESVLLVYFSELSTKYKPSTLWSHYSKLKSTLNINQGINIETYSKLQALLKRKSEGFISKKANTFTPESINKFLTEAPDDKYLATKVALIMGVMGACRANEMYLMKTEHLKDLGSAFLVNVPHTKTKVPRKFTVTDKMYQICRKYINLRPPHVTSNILFLNYQHGKCTSQRIGINKFTAMGKQIAEYLHVPNPEAYSGHSFRPSSATILVDAGGDITSLKRHGGWRSKAVAENYIAESMRNKMETANKRCARGINLTFVALTFSVTHLSPRLLQKFTRQWITSLSLSRVLMTISTFFTADIKKRYFWWSVNIFLVIAFWCSLISLLSKYYFGSQ